MRRPRSSFVSRSTYRQQSPHAALLTAAVMGALAVSVPAQLQFDVLPRKPMPPSLVGDPSGDLAFGDVDGDGDLDLVKGNYVYHTGWGSNQLLLNDGTGAFTDVSATQLPAATWDQTWAVALGDVDGDGDLDIVFGNRSAQNRLLINNGSGTFADLTATQMPVDSDFTEGLALGDVDGDGDLDLVCANGGWSSGEQNKLYLNNGAGVFTDATATQFPLHADFTSAIAFGDVDGDCDLDVVTGNLGLSPGGQDRVYVNNGSGTFTDLTATQMPAILNSTLAVEFGDVEGDGDLDIVTGTLYQQNRVYVNNGSGTFTDVTSAQMPTNLADTHALVLGDIDGDGDLDLAAGNGNNYWGGASRLYLNDGTGTFSDVSSRLPIWPYWTTSGAIADVDADGDLDLAFGGQSRLLFNLQRQLDAPVDLRIGQTYTLDAYMRYGPPSVSDFALPAVSFAPASVPLPPFGTLGIDPNHLVALPLIVIPQPAGVGSLNLSIVNDPGLIGTAIYSQALLVPITLQATLSNVVFDVLQ